MVYKQIMNNLDQFIPCYKINQNIFTILNITSLEDEYLRDFFWTYRHSGFARIAWLL